MARSTNYAEPSIEDYDERRTQQLAFWKARNGLQGGDPAKLAQALMTIINQEQPPLHFIAGADAIATAEQVVSTLQLQIDAFRDLSTSLAFDEAGNAASPTASRHLIVAGHLRLSATGLAII